MRKLLSIFAVACVGVGGWSTGCGGDTSDDSGATTQGGSGGSSAGGAAGSAGQSGGAGGKAGSNAGASGQPPSGSGGSGGSAQAGAGGSAQAGSGGSAQAGQGGSSQAGSGGSAGSSQGGSAGSAQAGSGGGSGSAQAGSGGSSGSAQGGSAGSAQAGQSGQGGATCNGVEFPSFDKGCTEDKNCSFGMHTVNCCGSELALGFNHAFKDAFEKAEVSWDACLPACGCGGGMATAEDGKLLSEGQVAVACTKGKCMTYVQTTGSGGAAGAAGAGGAGGECSKEFPTFDDKCTNDQSCSFGLHKVDCCGSLDAVAFNHAFKEAFEQAEATYEKCNPAVCNCVAKPTTTDKGSVEQDGSIGVSCQSGVCRTFPK